ncbi:subunit NDUFA5 [Blastocystis hominis]|uniref:Subunit NDUFA5 n=1 Tax=Blastocystis hominis TaxID=12968 RepID=D8M6P2_BLAHO|nr:subunit NDUFA5 [Blastocystis hominis]CBK23460.2 subunit NDUFA5 [Blastocystis hominis]|eukprot:XP_012897508.1 subunit NDUFA5 [Blastocystis hominis]
MQCDMGWFMTCCRMFVTRALCSMVKRTTGLVGVPVIPNARAVLTELYDKTLENVKKIPADTEYRKNVEAFTTYRRRIVQENEDVKTIEKIIGCGQVEELVEQANDELSLIEDYYRDRLWEGPKIENP